MKAQNLKTVWDVLTACASGIRSGEMHRVLLWGPPGTGKSYWAQSQYGKESVDKVTLHGRMEPLDLLWDIELKDANTIRHDGPALRCLRQGRVLQLDEIGEQSAALDCLLYSLLDDTPSCRITLPSGERVEPGAGYSVVATTNNRPDSLRPALLDRFDLVLYVGTPAPGLQCTALGGKLGKYLETVYARMTPQAETAREVSARRMLSYSRMLKVLPEELAAQIAFGHLADQVRDALSVID